MKEFGIILIILGVLVMIAGIYLIRGKKGDFTQVLLWKNNVKNMTINEVTYVGKVTVLVSVAIIVSGIIAIFLKESFIPFIILIVTFVFFLIIGVKIFK